MERQLALRIVLQIDGDRGGQIAPGRAAADRDARRVEADLGGMVEREQVISPAIIVVGEVVLLSDAENRLQALAKQAEALS